MKDTYNIVVYILILIVLYILSLYLNHKTNQIGEEYYTLRKINKKINPKIYDISHKYLPDLYNYENNLLNIIPLGVTIPLIMNLKIFMEFLNIFIIILIIRSVLIYVTILPGHKYCKNNQYKFFEGGCYDKIISGHTAYVFLSTLYLYKYKLLSKTSLILLNLMNSFILLSIRSHYTVDILLGYLLTGLIFQNKYKCKI